MSVLGKGGYGTVMQVRGNAVKKFHKINHAVAEYCALRHTEPCEYIVNATFASFSEIKVGMELFSSNLRNWARTHGAFSTAEYFASVKQILHDMLMGLVYLHDRGMIHTDVRLSNILVKKRDGKWRAVLGDCGLVTVACCAKTTCTDKRYRDPVHTRSWAHDIYSLGVCMFELFSSTTVGKPMTHAEFSRAVSALVPDEYRELIMSLLDPTPDLRPTARHLLQRMFQLSPPRWTNPYVYHVDATFSNSLEGLRGKMASLCNQHRVNRHNQGFVAARYFLNERPALQKYSRVYIAAAAYICFSCFTYKRPAKEDMVLDIKTLCRFSKSSRNTLYTCIAQLCEDEDFTELLYAQIP